MQGFANAVKVTDAPAGDGFGTGFKIEYLHRNITLVSSVNEDLENRGELQFPKARAPSVGIIDVDMPQIPAPEESAQNLRKRGVFSCGSTPAVKGNLKAGVADLLDHAESLIGRIDEVGLSTGERFQAIEDPVSC